MPLSYKAIGRISSSEIREGVLYIVFNTDKSFQKFICTDSTLIDKIRKQTLFSNDYVIEFKYTITKKGKEIIALGKVN